MCESARFKTWGKLRRLNDESTDSFALASISPLLKPLFSPVAKFSWQGGENIPKTGPVIIAANHISSLDPVLLGLFLAHQGRWPHYLARANLWENKLLKKILVNSGQIPVHRATAKAIESLAEAEKSLVKGNAVIIYPEGTITFDPLEWPMAIHVGVAKLALMAKQNVVPVGQWGANYLLPPRKIRKPSLKRREIRVVAGQPVALSDLFSDSPDRESVGEARRRIFKAILAKTADARREPIPETVWNHRKKQRVSPVEPVR